MAMPWPCLALSTLACGIGCRSVKRAIRFVR
jgi:hypothetical protein